jgi:hypothetical protein
MNADNAGILVIGMGAKDSMRVVFVGAMSPTGRLREGSNSCYCHSLRGGLYWDAKRDPCRSLFKVGAKRLELPTSSM